MRISAEERNQQYRDIYERLFEIPRITKKDLSLLLEVTRKTIMKRFKEAFDIQYIVGPQIRKRSYENLKEYVYFVNCKVPERLFEEYREDQNVIYHGKTMGFCDLFVIAKEKMDIKGDIIIEGCRSDYYVPCALDRTWDSALRTMREKVECFIPAEYVEKNRIKNHLEQSIRWNKNDEILFRYFKYDLRRSIEHVAEEKGVYRRDIYRWFDRLPETCTIFTDFYPGGISSYDPYLFMFETDYEDFIVDLFSELPATTSFFKVLNKLCALAHIPMQYVRTSDLHRASNRLPIPLLMLDLLDRGIIKDKAQAIVECSWGKDL